VFISRAIVIDGTASRHAFPPKTYLFTFFVLDTHIPFTHVFCMTPVFPAIELPPSRRHGPISPLGARQQRRADGTRHLPRATPYFRVLQKALGQAIRCGISSPASKCSQAETIFKTVPPKYQPLFQKTKMCREEGLPLL